MAPSLLNRQSNLEINPKNKIPCISTTQFSKTQSFYYSPSKTQRLFYLEKPNTSLKNNDKIHQIVNRGWILSQILAWPLDQHTILTLSRLFSWPNQQKKKLIITLKDVRRNIQWNLNNLSYRIPKYIQSQITDTYFLTNVPHQDKLWWDITTNASFTVSSCYHILTNTNNISTTLKDNILNLNWIWKTRVPYKINNFMWLCWHNKIKSNSLLSHKGLNIDPHCLICPTIEENTNHILRTCTQAAELWSYFSPQAAELWSYFSPHLDKPTYELL